MRLLYDLIIGLYKQYFLIILHLTLNNNYLIFYLQSFDLVLLSLLKCLGHFDSLSGGINQLRDFLLRANFQHIAFYLGL